MPTPNDTSFPIVVTAEKITLVLRLVTFPWLEDAAAMILELFQAASTDGRETNPPQRRPSPDCCVPQTEGAGKMTLGRIIQRWFSGSTSRRFQLMFLLALLVTGI